MQELIRMKDLFIEERKKNEELIDALKEKENTLHILKENILLLKESFDKEKYSMNT